MPAKIKDVIKKLESEGWYLHHQRGSHRQFKHPVKPGKVTVPGKPSDDVWQDLAASIKRQAGWSELP